MYDVCDCHNFAVTTTDNWDYAATNAYADTNADESPHDASW
eukprot:COSAG01_NODE_59854_length_297_cov_56.030303_1_plen_41_part_00